MALTDTEMHTSRVLPSLSAGFNRTGFVLCSYLVQVCNLSVQEALDSFAVARPPGIRSVSASHCFRELSISFRNILLPSAPLRVFQENRAHFIYFNFQIWHKLSIPKDCL